MAADTFMSVRRVKIGNPGIGHVLVTPSSLD